jgi:hypothetical protein
MKHRASYLAVLVWCTGCYHQVPADLQAIIHDGLGDEPLNDLRFRCTRCGISQHIDHVVVSRDALWH